MAREIELNCEIFKMDEETFIALNFDYNVFGTGPTPEEAVNDLTGALERLGIAVDTELYQGLIMGWMLGQM